MSFHLGEGKKKKLCLGFKQLKTGLVLKPGSVMKEFSVVLI